MPPYPGQPNWSGQPAPPYQQSWGGPVGVPGWYGQPPPHHWQQPPAVKPGVIPLRPLDLGEILDGAISTMRAHPRLVLGVAAIVVIITQLLTVAATFPLMDDLNRVVQFDENTSPDELWSAVGASLAVSAIALVLTIVSRVFLSGFLTVVVGSAVLGQKLSFGEVWTRVRPRLLPLLGLTLIYPAVTVGAVLLVVLLTAAVPPIGILAGLGAIVVGIWLWVMFSLATPALVLERAGVGRAFGRSRHLVRGAWWRIFGITLLAVVIAVILALIISVPFELLGGGFSLTGTAAVTTQYLLLSSVGTIIASTLTEPFVAAVTVLLYTDQRMRKEGLDIELARAAGTPR